MAYADPKQSSLPDPNRPTAAPRDSLPPVEPPSAGFLVQLFLVPGLIVAIIVVVWVLVDWLAHMDADPKQYVDGLRRDSKDSWQKAYNLADMLRSDRAGELKNNADLANQLASILDERLAAGKLDESSIQLRFYLSKALGEFNTPEGLPMLLKAIATNNDEKDLPVREAAIESLGKLILNVRAAHPESTKNGPLAQSEVLEALLKTSRDPKPELRLRAASVLGILGGPEAMARLKDLLDDPAPDVAMNAATGLARQGDAAGLGKLLEMLSPDEKQFVENDPENLQADKRLYVMLNGLRGIEALLDAKAEASPMPDLSRVEKSVERLKGSEFPLEIRDAAMRVADKLRGNKVGRRE